MSFRRANTQVRPYRVDVEIRKLKAMSEIKVHQLQNKHWQVGILPQTGASIAYGRVRYGGIWLDVMRPTPESDYHNPSLSSSFLMIPWSNRIREGRIHFSGATYHLNNLKSDGTAMHGDVRHREWEVLHADDTSIKLSFDSTQHENVNFPFRFQSEVEYKLRDDDFVMTIKLKSIDERDFPAGFGLHPYFVRPDGANTPQVKIPCEMHYELQNALPTTGIPQPLPEHLDFLKLRTIDEREIDDVFTGRIGKRSAQIYYPEWNIKLDFNADSTYRHFVFYTPQNKPFFALEPVTNANDGFNLYNKGIADTGVFLLKPNQEKQATAYLHVQHDYK